MSLVELVRETFESANATEGGQRLFRRLEGEALGLAVEDGEDAHVVFEDGTATVHSGTAPDGTHTIGATEETFRELFEGRTRFVDAAWNGELNAEVYHGRPDLYFAVQQAIKIHVPALEPEPF